MKEYIVAYKIENIVDGRFSRAEETILGKANAKVWAEHIKSIGGTDIVIRAAK